MQFVRQDSYSVHIKCVFGKRRMRFETADFLSSYCLVCVCVREFNPRASVRFTKSDSLVPLQMKSLLRKIGAQICAFISI